MLYAEKDIYMMQQLNNTHYLPQEGHNERKKSALLLHPAVLCLPSLPLCKSHSQGLPDDRLK